jgi:hypothetical protein
MEQGLPPLPVMRIRTLAVTPILLLCLADAAAPPAAAAQARPKVSADYLFKPGNVTVTISAGGSAFTDFQQDPTTLMPGRDAGTRRVSAQTAATVGTSLAVWLSSSLALQIDGSYTPTRFRVSNDLLETDAFDPDSTQYARLDLWNATGNVLLRPVVSFGRLAPYAILGAGIIRYQVRDDPSLIPPEAQARFDGGGRTQFLAVLGAGGLIPLQRKRLLLSFDITDHLTQTPLADRARTTPEGRTYGTDGITLTSNVRLTVGLTIPLRLQPAKPR